MIVSRALYWNTLLTSRFETNLSFPFSWRLLEMTRSAWTVSFVSSCPLVGLLSYQLDMLYNVYSTPEALHKSKLTQELVNVMCILFKKHIYSHCIGPHALIHICRKNPREQPLELADVCHVEISWFSCGFSDSTVYFCCVLVFGVRKTLITIFKATVTNCLVYDCENIGSISSHNAVYALIMIYIQYPSKAWFVLSYYQKLCFQPSY